MADFFTCAVRTGQKGMAGISLVLLERTMPGISIRRMKTQFDSCHGTTFIILEDVRVPKANLIGKEGQGFGMLVRNFNHERWVIAAGAARSSRLCYEEAIHEAMSRQTFGKPLVQHQLIRFKLAEMARMVESLQDNLEKVAYQFNVGVQDSHLGSMCALLKVNASKTFE
jgi:alkylation response protein AidB-like acyl-CoA dehydrogenase